jgi:prephenate dehydrogenase
MVIRRLSVLGVGLLGGSIGLAAKSALSDFEIVGYGHRKATLERAKEVGAIDRIATKVTEAVEGADLIILCTPVGIFEPLIGEMVNVLKPGAIVTDVGSTKRSVVSLAEQTLPDHVHFVGSHPMAGSEKRGVEFARADLFQNAMCILTPTPRTDPKAEKEVTAFWQSLGMRTTRLSPEEHDRLLADVSHLPHALAAALVTMQSEKALTLAGKGFLDATRIAGGDGALWRDILMDNRDNVLASIGELKKHLGALEKLLSGEGRDELAKWLDRAAARRAKLLEQKLREINPD